MLLTYSITVRGKVQGVFFRQTTRDKAQELGIRGKVNNQADGSVAILATGPRDKLEELLRWCHEGPPRAQVEEVIFYEMAPLEFAGFTVERD
ncbi:MAG TPA: acylphosphatase [Chitinophagaceae bacterium]|nr:acylphosphatase [Chitinophagaceae bacterium]